MGFNALIKVSFVGISLFHSGSSSLYCHHLLTAASPSFLNPERRVTPHTWIHSPLDRTKPTTLETSQTLGSMKIFSSRRGKTVFENLSARIGEAGVVGHC